MGVATSIATALLRRETTSIKTLTTPRLNSNGWSCFYMLPGSGAASCTAFCAADAKGATAISLNGTSNWLSRWSTNQASLYEQQRASISSKRQKDIKFLNCLVQFHTRAMDMREFELWLHGLVVRALDFGSEGRVRSPRRMTIFQSP